MPSELSAEESEVLKEGAQFAIFLSDTGEQITEWQSADADGSISFDFSAAVTDYEIGMMLADGTVLLGEPTHIEAID